MKKPAITEVERALTDSEERANIQAEVWHLIRGYHREAQKLREYSARLIDDEHARLRRFVLEVANALHQLDAFIGARGEGSDHADSYQDAVPLIADILRRALQQAGYRVEDPSGAPYSPAIVDWAEATAYVDSDLVAEAIVERAIQPAVFQGSALLQPAKVIVAVPRTDKHSNGEDGDHD